MTHFAAFRRRVDPHDTVVTISRGVTHRSGSYLIGATKTSETRSVTIPPHIRDDVKAHLSRHVSYSLDALLINPVRGGCQLKDRLFNKDVFKRASKDVGREDLSAHDLRRFAGSKNAQVATLAENMARLGHSTVNASLRYQHSESGRDAAIAAAPSARNAVARLPG
ncbi:site-specific integrase [Mycobacterium sp. DSM 3803]|nr:site-specific integrase [Mycobacterium sp. DSM 3803]